MLTSSGEIRRDEGCIDYAGKYVMVYPCHGMMGNQQWVYGMVSSLWLLLQYTTLFSVSIESIIQFIYGRRPTGGHSSVISCCFSYEGVDKVSKVSRI